MFNLQIYKEFSVLLLLAVMISILLTTNTNSYNIQKTVSIDFNRQVECMAKNIYYEAAMEPYEGKLAVAQVTMNRVNHPEYPKDVCGVVYQKTGRTCQFSWTCIDVPEIKSRYNWEESLIVAKKALTEPFVHDRIAETNSLFYHATYINPQWKKKVVMVIGNHIFYKRYDKT